MTRPLGQQVVVITGGSSGIGRETALELARAGARMTVIARGPRLATWVNGEPMVAYADITRTLDELAHGLVKIEAEVELLTDPDGQATRTNLTGVVSDLEVAMAIIDGNARDGRNLLDRSLAINPHNATAWISSSFARAHSGDPRLACHRCPSGVRRRSRCPRVGAARRVRGNRISARHG